MRRDLLDRPIDNLPTLTARAAANWADRPALVFDEIDRTLSFAELDAESNATARVLSGLGVTAGDRVAVMLRNRPEFPVVWLALAKLGAAMVPMNIHYKEADASFVLTHSGANTIITQAEFAPLVGDVVSAAPGPRTVLHVDGGELAQSRSIAALVKAASTAAYEDTSSNAETTVNIQYTSGTTGHPKGCVLSHYYWTRLARVVSQGPPALTEDDVLLTAQPFYYMDPQWNLAGCLMVGATLVVLDRFHPSTFWDKVREHGVTFFYCLGMMPAAMYAMPQSAQDRDNKVRAIACSAIPTRLHAALEARWGAPWYEAFGMTETGGDLRMMPADHDESVGSGCIGRLYPDREMRVSDTDGHVLPRGTPGEMLLRGPGMMDGYFNDSQATNEAFRGGWFHTGDLVRQDNDGLVYYLGRIKDTVRRSGENISTAEVEGVIIEHPGVAAAACVPVPDDLRGEEVKAYVVPLSGADGEPLDPVSLAEWCAARLAYFKVPRYWAFVDDLPRTPSERVAKSKLTAGVDDLRVGAFDRSDNIWR